MPAAMDAYPPDYVLHNLPFIVLSGLESSEELETLPPVQNVLPGRATTTVSADNAPLTGHRAQQLLQEFRDAQGSNAPWNGRGSNHRGNGYSFRIRTAGRVGQQSPCTQSLRHNAHA